MPGGRAAASPCRPSSAGATAQLPQPPSRGDDGRLLECHRCAKTFALRRDLALHQAEEQGRGDENATFQCQECHRKFRRLASLKAHLDVHFPDDEDDDVVVVEGPRGSKQARTEKPSVKEDPLSCPQCPRRFRQKSSLQEHLREHRRIQLLLKTRKIKKRQVGAAMGRSRALPYACKFCHKSFHKPSQCQRHERIHTGEKPFKCEQCGKSFSQKNSLQIHSRCHQGIKPYECQICHAKFAQNGNLRTHILRVHSGFSTADGGERLFRCPQCPCAFRVVGSLNAHIIRSHGGDVKSGQSQVVALTVKAKDGSYREKQPMIRDTEKRDRRYLCSHCPKRFGKPVSLARHLRQRHRLDVPPSEAPPADVTAVVPKPSDLIRRRELSQKGVQDDDRLCGGAAVVTEDGLIVIDPSAMGMDLSQLTFAPPTAANPVLTEDCDVTLQTGIADGDADEKVALEEKHKELKAAAAEADEKQDEVSYSYVGNDEQLTEDPLSHDLNDVPLSLSDEEADGKGIEVELKPAASEALRTTVKPEGPETSHHLYQQLLTEKDREQSSTRTKIHENVDPVLSSSSHQNACSVCGISFKKPSDLTRHIRTHTGEKPFACSLCEKCFSLKSTLTSHLRTHEGEDVRRAAAIPCHLCSLTFVKKSALKAHLRRHTGGKPYTCNLCHLAFRTPAMRKAHVHKSHLQAGNPPNPRSAKGDAAAREVGVSSPEPGLHISVPAASLSAALAAVSEMGVPLLGSTIKLQLDFRPSDKDRERHGGEQASREGRSGGTVTQLTVNTALINQLAEGGSINLVLKQPENSIGADVNHHAGTIMETHPEDSAPHAVESQETPKTAPPPPPEKAIAKSNVCPVCAKAFKKPSQVRRHLCVHTGEKRHRCGLCAKAFTQRNSLLIHVRTVHGGERVFRCPFCDLASSQKANLTTHIERVHAEKAKKLVEVTGMEAAADAAARAASAANGRQAGFSA